MTHLGANSWGKSEVRVSKVRRRPERHEFSDLTVGVQLGGEVEAAFREGDNRGVVPTDTMRNTVYVLAHRHLESDLEGFAAVLARHFRARDGIDSASVRVEERRWQRVGPAGFVGGSSELRTARVEAGPGGETVWGGLDGLVVLKTTGSSFTGFPIDELTTLPEKEDRILATTVAVEWRYDPVAADTTAAWETARAAVLSGFFDAPSASIQQQGWMMGEALLAAVPEIAEASFRLPNQHHLDFDLERFGGGEGGVTFHPVAEPYGDIRFTITR